MGRLSQYQDKQVFRFDLPAPYSGEWIECPTQVPINAILELMTLGPTPTPEGMETLMVGMQSVITGWSFTDDDDQPLPVNRETLGQIPWSLWTALLEAYGTGLQGLDPKAPRAGD